MLTADGHFEYTNFPFLLVNNMKSEFTISTALMARVSGVSTLPKSHFDVPMSSRPSLHAPQLLYSCFSLTSPLI